MDSQSTPSANRLCSVDGCDHIYYARGLCKKHYSAYRRSVPSLPPIIRKSVYRRPPYDRFIEKVVIEPSGCWRWTASVSTHGYGMFSIGAHTNCPAHRWSYQHFVGPIPEGLDLDHLCRNRWCVNPEHLEPVTRRENVLRGDTPTARNLAKTHCIHGHEFTPENTYEWPRGGYIARKCRQCQKESRRRRYLREKNREVVR